NELVAEVIDCSAAVPAHSLISASCAAVMSVDATEVPPTVKAPAAPLVLEVSCSRYCGSPLTSVPDATLSAVTPASDLLMAVTRSSSEVDAAVISTGP